MNIVLKRLDDKPKVSNLTLKLGNELMNKISIHEKIRKSFPLVLQILSNGLSNDARWKTKLGTLQILSVYMQRVFDLDRDLLSASLPNLVKILTDMIHDTKPEVSQQAEETCLLALKGITNRDLEPFIEDLLKAIKIREETEETIQKLAGVVFVQTVEGSALSVVVPLMIAGLKTNKAIIKRMCARIVSNMSKLVEEPIEALPFLGELIPAFRGSN